MQNNQVEISDVLSINNLEPNPNFSSRENKLEATKIKPLGHEVLETSNEKIDESDDEWNYVPLQDGEDEKQETENSEKRMKDAINGVHDKQTNNQNSAKDDTEKKGENEKKSKMNENVPVSDELSYQLNPYAKEFIPNSPPDFAKITNGYPKFQQRLEDDVLAQSPRKPSVNMEDIQIPAEDMFDKEASLRPHEVAEEVIIPDLTLNISGNSNDDKNHTSHKSLLDECILNIVKENEFTKEIITTTANKNPLVGFCPMMDFDNDDMNRSIYIENLNSDIKDDESALLNQIQTIPDEFKDVLKIEEEKKDLEIKVNDLNQHKISDDSCNLQTNVNTDYLEDDNKLLLSLEATESNKQLKVENTEKIIDALETNNLQSFPENTNDSNKLNEPLKTVPSAALNTKIQKLSSKCEKINETRKNVTKPNVKVLDSKTLQTDKNLLKKTVAPPVILKSKPNTSHSATASRIITSRPTTASATSGAIRDPKTLDSTKINAQTRLLRKNAPIPTTRTTTITNHKISNMSNKESEALKSTKIGTQPKIGPRYTTPSSETSVKGIPSTNLLKNNSSKIIKPSITKTVSLKATIESTKNNKITEKSTKVLSTSKYPESGKITTSTLTSRKTMNNPSPPEVNTTKAIRKPIATVTTANNGKMLRSTNLSTQTKKTLPAKNLKTIEKTNKPLESSELKDSNGKSNILLETGISQTLDNLKEVTKNVID